MGSVINPSPHPLDSYLDDRPPAPILEIVVKHKLDSASARLRACLDTGADWSLLAPWGLQKLEESLGFLPLKPIRVDGGLVPAYELRFSFDSGTHWYAPDGPVELGLRPNVWPGPTEDLIIGRDVLCSLEFCCNGPSNTLTLRDPLLC